MRRIIAAVAALAGLAVLADFSAAAYAEYRVSRAVRAGAELDADPAVTIHGFPFIAQLVKCDFDDIEIRAREMRPDVAGSAPGGSGIYVVAHLRGVRLPRSKLLDGSVRTVHASGVDGDIFIDPTELGRLLGIRDLQVSTPPADRSDGSGGSGGSGMTTVGPIVLMGTVPLSSTAPDTAGSGFSAASMVSDPTTGTPMQRVSVQAQVALDDDQLLITADQLYVGRYGRPDTPVPAADLPGVLGRFSKLIPLPPLPFGLPPAQVNAFGGQLVIGGTGRDLTVSLDHLQRP
jgi:hypothetical protein